MLESLFNKVTGLKSCERLLLSDFSEQLVFREAIFKNFLSSNEQKVTSNEQKVTSNEQKVTNNEQKVTSNEQ